MDVLPPAAELTRRLPQAIAERVGWHLGHRASRVDRVAKLQGGARLIVDVADYGHRQIYFLGEYEPGTTRLLRRLAKPGWTMLDVGANIGYFSLLGAALGAPGARAVAFEPNPDLADMLARSVQLNPALDIRLEQLAVGARPGVLPLHLTSDHRNTGLSSLRPDLPDTDGGTIPVTVTTIDDYCAAEGLAPDLVKIDVEGFELQVLRGADKTLSNAPPGAVICEVDPAREDPQGLIDLMRFYGYVPHTITERGELRSDATIGPGSATENLCFTPAGR